LRKDRCQVARAGRGDQLGSPSEGGEIDLEILGPAGVAAEQKPVGRSRPGERIGDRFLVEGDLLPRTARVPDMMELDGLAKPGADQHRAVGQPILEIGRPHVLIAAQRLDESRRRFRNVLEHKLTDLAPLDGRRRGQSGAGRGHQ